MNLNNFAFLFLVITTISSIILLVFSSSPFVLAKKEILVPKPVKDAIPLIRCSVCEHTMFQIVRNTLDYISDYQVRHKLKEEKLIDRVFEPVCAPLRPGGSWLRGADWEIVNPVHDTEEVTLVSTVAEIGSSTQFQFKLRETHEKSFKCGARCSTAAAACDLIMRGSSTGSDDVVGRITSTLIKHFPKLLKAVEKEEQEEASNEKIALDENKIDVDPEKEMVELAKILVMQICRKKPRISGCHHSTSAKKKSSPSQNKKITPAVVHADTLEEMELKEVEVEEMMHRMKYGFKDGGASSSKSSNSKNKRRSDDDDDEDQQGGVGAAGNPGLDVYSKDEMLKLREALKSGDRETLRELDPQSEDLSDEEFEMLSGMHKKEFGGQ